MAESKLGDYLSQVTNIPALQNLIADYLKQWVNFKTITGHIAPITSLSYSPDYAKATSGRPDNKYLASGSFDKTIKIWDSSTYKLLQTLNLTFPVRAISFEQNGKYLSSVDGKNIKIWHYTYPYEVKELKE